MEIIILIAFLAFILWRICVSYNKKRIQKYAKELVNYNMSLMNEKKAKIEAKGIPYVHHDINQGIFQMVNFPYGSFEEWNAEYNKAAIESNPALSHTTTDDGVTVSILDFLDIEPCRRAYNHHLDPKKLGSKFGENFNLGDIQFQDGKKTRDFIKETHGIEIG